MESALREIECTLNENMASFQSLITRFQRATVRQLQSVGSSPAAVRAADDVNFDDVLDEDAVRFDELESGNRNGLKEDIESHSVYRSVRSFLKERGYGLSGDGVNGGGPRQSVLVSLSGGVDSMAITQALCDLKQFEGGMARLQIVCIHIDYGNRPESHREALFLSKWCGAKGVALRVRTITAIKRGVTRRDEYERISRRIRFESYRAAMAEFAALSGGVMLGHHRGDVEENVISNVMKGGCGGTLCLHSLSGMAPQSVVKGVAMWRPLLRRSKREIFDFAHKFGVPYFKDSTPKWSNRGRMRNELLPLLSDLFGDGVRRNLSALNDDSAAFGQMTRKKVFDSVFSAIEHSECSAWIHCEGNPFWRS